MFENLIKGPEQLVQGRHEPTETADKQGRR